MMEIKLELVAFQVTRRCNQNCNHCCKGIAQNIDMSKEIVDNFFVNSNYKIKEMTHLVITGGEPTLVPDIVEYIINKIIDENINITKYINIFTNGLIYSEKVIKSIEKLIIYLKTKEECQNTLINFKISNDQFHKKIPENILEKYSKVDFVSKEWLKPFELSKSEIQNDGNAKINNLGGTLSIDYSHSTNYIEKNNNEIKIKNGIYISANGNICNDINGCSTFEQEDNCSYGNLIIVIIHYLIWIFIPVIIVKRIYPILIQKIEEVN